MDTLLAAVGCALVYLESWPIGQFLLGRPVVLLPLLGFAAGLPVEGLWLGLVLELILLRTLPMGSTLPPDPALGGAWALGSAWLAFRNGGWTAAESMFDPGIGLLLLGGVLLSWLAPWLTELQRRINGRLWHPRFEHAVMNGDVPRCNLLMPLVLAQSFGLALLLSYLVLVGGTWLLGHAAFLQEALAASRVANWLPPAPVLLVVAWGGLWQLSAGKRGRKALWSGLAVGVVLLLLTRVVLP